MCCTKARMRWIEDLCIDVIDFVVNKGMRALGPVLALAATCLISLCCYEYFQEVFPFLVAIKYEASPLMPYFVTTIGLYLLISIFFNHQSCVWTSPGYSPLTIALYPRRCQEIPAKYYRFDPELKAHDVVRYCNQCRCYKSWRAHHCSICKRCVLKMDHHCPWMWNCVGYANYRYFFMFLVYLWVGTLFYVWVGYDALFQSFRVKSCRYPWLPFFFCRIARLRHRVDDEGERVAVDRNELFVFSYFLSIGICLVMVAFLSFHSYLLVTNQSTLETMTNFSARARSFRRWTRLRDVKRVYSLHSVAENVKEVFGEKWYLALLPIWTSPRGNGFIYPLRPEIREVLFNAMPPANGNNDIDAQHPDLTLP